MFSFNLRQHIYTVLCIDYLIPMPIPCRLLRNPREISQVYLASRSNDIGLLNHFPTLMLVPLTFPDVHRCKKEGVSEWQLYYLYGDSFKFRPR